MPQAVQAGAVYQTSQDLLESDLPHLAVVIDARGYAIQRDTDGSWYSVASVSSSDLVGAYTLIHLPAAPLPGSAGSVVITKDGLPFMRRWDARTDHRSQPERWIGPNGATLTDADLRRRGVVRTWDAGTADRPAGDGPSGGPSIAAPPVPRH